MGWAGQMDMVGIGDVGGCKKQIKDGHGGLWRSSKQVRCLMQTPEPEGLLQ